MEGVKVQRIDRKSSIENEPRTLDFHQIQWAREAAMFVMSNAKNFEEALSIFTEGLEPTVSLGQKNGDRGDMDTIGNYESLGNDIRLPVIRDIASAPF
ncbi:hypothetical protein HS088_TW22G01410 [Tripterygium wilfordii]|uniref:Uncharacterized protein n=1 Tax=Tripterygium wilfordii TaxID=458696 RepID=A0A7J7C0S1_TRIWF|nr:hypothetical protein HS088_TW22G01410 [Tripterygium wilfordii]